MLATAPTLPTVLFTGSLAPQAFEFLNPELVPSITLICSPFSRKEALAPISQWTRGPQRMDMPPHTPPKSIAGFFLIWDSTCHSAETPPQL